MALTVLVALPTAALFLRVRSDVSADRADTELKQQGVTYLVALAPLISALADSQSQALQGVTAEPASLTSAVARVQEADGNLGATLGTTNRWNGIKEKITNLPAVTGNSQQIFQAHVEVGDLALALYTEVRKNSKLNMDPQQDIWYLQETITVNMPRTVTAVSRMSDLANMHEAAARAQKPALQVQLGVELDEVQSGVAELTENLQAAADVTDSASLAGNTLNNLDSFRRGVEAAVRGANFNGSPDVSTLVTAQSTLSTALNALTTVLLKEIQALLDTRSDDLSYRQIESWVLITVAVLLILLAAFWTRSGTAPAGQPGDGAAGRDISVHNDGPPGTPGPGTYGGSSSPYDQVPGYGEAPNYGGGAAGRERSGALR
ncbi:hypothetical protein [Actinoplanes couchii]|uniref:hypothetical protein n=1 Tax=Actinoplanes couchii TaxID=403638 RepID=UPI001EF1836B|nr:hypothetical protein [Actinoplanes couchii]MDR6324723.1 hypothetical protein [Actinoplanes couchii]